jgi:hypothetical protein
MRISQTFRLKVLNRSSDAEVKRAVEMFHQAAQTPGHLDAFVAVGPDRLHEVFFINERQSELQPRAQLVENGREAARRLSPRDLSFAQSLVDGSELGKLLASSGLAGRGRQSAELIADREIFALGLHPTRKQRELLREAALPLAQQQRDNFQTLHEVVELDWLRRQDPFTPPPTPVNGRPARVPRSVDHAALAKAYALDVATHDAVARGNREELAELRWLVLHPPKRPPPPVPDAQP